MDGSNAEAQGSSSGGFGDVLRSQSTLTIAVVVVVVLAVAGAGAVLVLSDSGDDSGTDSPGNGNDSPGNGDDNGNASGPTRPDATLAIDVTAGSITVTHESGETIGSDEIGVTVLAGGQRSELDLLGFGGQPAQPDRFAPGDQFVQNGGPYAGNVTVFVLHEPTNVRLADTTVTVDPELRLNISGITDPAGDALSAGDDVAVTYSLEAPNGTVESGVTVTVDGEVALDEQVTVEGGTTVTEEVTAGADLGDGLDVTVETEYGSAAETLTGPSLGVSFAGGPDTSPGAVGYTVENTGDIGDEQTVTLTSTAANGSVVEERERLESVPGGGAVTGTFQTVAVDAGGELGLSAAGDTATLAVGESDFQVVGIEAPDEVTVGGALSVGYEVENAGAFVDTQTVTFTVGGTEVDSEQAVTLDAGATTSGAFSYVLTADDTAGVTVGVSTADDTAEAAVSVVASAASTFSVDITAVKTPVTVGGTLGVTADIENTGEQAGSQAVTFDLSAFGTNTTEVSLDSGESTQVTASATVTEGSAGTYSATVSTVDDEASAEFEVVPGADPEPVFEVLSFDAPNEVDAGADLTVTYEIENTGEGEGTQDVAFLVDGTEVATTGGVTLDAGETFSDTFTYTGTGGNAGATLTVAVSTDDDSLSAGVSVSSGTTPGGDLVASLSTEQGSVGETVSVDLNVVSPDGTSRPFGSYTVIISYDDSVLQYKGLTPGTWGSPVDVNSDGNVVAVADFAPSGSSPAEPALTFEFEVIGDGTATIEFDNDAPGVPSDNVINDNSGDAYQTTFQDGSVVTT